MLRVTPIPCLADNYAYLLADASGDIAVVDPSEAAPVERALAGASGRLTAVLATHHHLDHVGGIADLVGRTPGLRVYGSAVDRGRIPEQTHFLEDGQIFTWGTTAVRALHVPGHTRGALAYVADDAVFTGDTLFVAGCGRLFEGTPAMMFRSLNQVLAALPAATRMYCGHEYTVTNLLFAQTVEPGNAAVAEQLARARALRAEDAVTVGGTLASERACNPFLRCQSAEIRSALGLEPGASDVDTFAALRRAKDVFRPPAATW